MSFLQHTFNNQVPKYLNVAAIPKKYEIDFVFITSTAFIFLPLL